MSHGLSTEVMVSPTFTSLEDLMPEMIYPTLPAESSFCGTCFICKTPISSASYSMPVLKNLTFSPVLMVPFMILKYAMMPLNELKTESKIRAWSGAFGSPLGAGIRLTMASRISGTPKPVRAEQRKISSRSQPKRSTIWSSTFSGCALSMSILFKIGITSKSWSIAMYRLLIV